MQFVVSESNMVLPFKYHDEFCHEPYGYVNVIFCNYLLSLRVACKRIKKNSRYNTNNMCVTLFQSIKKSEMKIQIFSHMYGTYSNPKNQTVL